MEADAVMLLRILREWYWTSGAEPRDVAARAHPLYPGTRCGDRRPLWAAVDAVLIDDQLDPCPTAGLASSPDAASVT